MTEMLCPYCGGRSRYRFSAKDRNQRSSERAFEYYACRACKLTFMGELPADLRACYVNEQYDIPPDATEFGPRAESQAWKVELVRRFLANGTLFEVGPATGEFAVAARQAGFRPKLAEMDEACCRFLRSELNFDVVETADPAWALAAEPAYDAICVWQAIEHIPEFWRLIDVAADRLARGGLLMVSTPNPRSLQARVLGRFWPHIDAPRHLYLIPSRWFVDWAGARGMEVVLKTTRDVGSLGLNYYGWYLAVRNLLPGRRAEERNHRLARRITDYFRPREEAEGAGCCYTIAFRRS